MMILSKDRKEELWVSLWPKSTRSLDTHQLFLRGRQEVMVSRLQTAQTVVSFGIKKCRSNLKLRRWNERRSGKTSPTVATFKSGTVSSLCTYHTTCNTLEIGVVSIPPCISGISPGTCATSGFYIPGNYHVTKNFKFKPKLKGFCTLKARASSKNIRLLSN